jgi:hypothetical protein
MTDAEIKELEVDYDLASADVNGERFKAVVTIVIVAIVNVANVFGFALDADAWINVVLSIASAASILYSWWKNQNVTIQAAQAQVLLNALKREAKLAKHAKAA